jgi:nucleotide-binding universal stress UspA family protein
VLKGDPVTDIAAHADRTGADMIVMATHARGGAVRALTGSTAGDVTNRCHVPVLCVHPGHLVEPGVPRRVLVPLDVSDLSDAVLVGLEPLARQLEWTLVLFSVAELPPPTLSLQGALIPLGPTPSTPPAEFVDHLDRTAERLRASGLNVETRVDTGGDRSDAIVAAAADADCGLVAMSTHGRRGLDRWVHGSVTDAVVRRADVPVLVVRPLQAPARRA